jgi:diguanylate cyclase (GGDEF)-like protein/excisionase family DNA binding protein
MPRGDANALLSVAQAATLLGVHPNTIRLWTDAGRLTAYRINERGDRRFRRSDVEHLLVETTAGPTGVATGEVADGRRTDRELRLFGRIAAGLASTPSPGAVARVIVEAVGSELDARQVAVYRAEGETLRLAAHAGWRRPPPAERPLEAAGAASPADGLVDVPLVTKRGPAGLLVVDRDTIERRPPEFVAALASAAATALAGARLLEHARRQLARTRALGQVTKELVGDLDLDRVLSDIIERTRTLFGADRAGLWLFDGTPHPVPLVTRNLSDAFLADGAGITPDTDTISVRAKRLGRALWARNVPGDRTIGAMRRTYRREGIRTVAIVPLLEAGRAVGVLGLYHDDDRTWPDEELELAQAFADQAAVAIQNARLYQSVTRGAARMRSIQELSTRLNRLTDVQAIADAIVSEARTLADYHDIRIYRVDRERGTCEPIAFTREMLDADPSEAVALLRVAIGEGFTGWVAENGKPLLINNALDDERGKTIDGTDDVPESMLLVPMLYEGRTVGVIVLSQLGFDRFTDDDLQTMSIFAGYAAQAMANAATYEQLVEQSTELGRRADSQRRLLEVSERLVSTLDPSDVLETIADGLRDVVAYDNLSIYRADHQQRLMLPVLTREKHAEEVGRYQIPFGRGLMGWAVDHKQPILANDALNDPRALQIPGTPADPEAVVVVPLVADAEVLGVLNVSRVGGDEVAFSTSDFELVQLFAAQASVALRNADAHHAVSLRAETDALTGLANHGAFQRDLADAIAALPSGARGPEARLSLLMCDLDNFKAYNDRHGHPAGDALLHRIATTIYGAARSDDRVYRYGGDEFALILPRATSAGAARAARRIRDAVAQLTATTPSPVAITIGVASVPADAVDRAGLIGAADSALYYGKRAGEGRVVRSDQLPTDIGDLRGTLEELAAAAVRDEDDDHAVEHLVERATHLAATQTADPDALHDALLIVSRSLADVGADAGHVDRVVRYATAIADELRLPPTERQAVELGAQLHGIEERAVAELSRIPSLRDVCALVIGQGRLQTEGVRRGRRAARARGRIGAHVIAVARAYDVAVSGGTGRRLSRRDAIDALRTDAATYRADVLDALARVVGGATDAGRRRRAGDAALEEARGAA